MSAILAARVRAKINAAGESFTVGANTYKGIIEPATPGLMSTFLNDSDIMGISNPGLSLFTVPDAVIAVDNTISRDGITYYAIRIYIHRVADVPIFMYVIWG